MIYTVGLVGRRIMSSAKGEHHQTVPLSLLLKREVASEKIEKPEVSYGQANHSKKGEDFTLLKTECQRVLGDDVTTYHVFGVCFDYQICFPALIFSLMANSLFFCFTVLLNTDLLLTE